MPCLFAVLALAVPRVVILLLYFFSNWFTGIFSTILWPVLGFIFLPTTLLWYTAVQRIGAARTAIYSNVVPIVAMTVAAVWLGEPLTPAKLTGAAAVVGGVALTKARRSL